ncbi:hypothetical protein ANN_26617 [Periplaneta americana]|uniref:DDE Tnp4 domain-containing protein n=1 Tax=Periplaneta americana TaxID=6978 RepID=A0ABQ8RYP9_PERAM|nr:hypothetical protein ANN_26617 [Periplaneta americana]
MAGLCEGGNEPPGSLKAKQPPEISQRVYMYSNYKSAYTAKVLIGIAPCGMVTFISKCYGGRASDSFITNDCGILKLIEPGDQIMADKGFPGIKTVLEESNAILVMPPFMNEGHLTPDQVDDTYNIASVRIHVERCIQRLMKDHDRHAAAGLTSTCRSRGGRSSNQNGGIVWLAR